MITTTRSRECKEGWGGRRRNYICIECHTKFQVDTLSPLPQIERVCPNCRERTYIYTFTNTRTGRDKQIRASDVELATLRAWGISPHLTFKITQPHPTPAIKGGDYEERSKLEEMGE